jgi:arginine utilization protein RocB
MHSLLQKEHGEAYTLHMEAFKEQLMQQTDLDTRMFAARVVEEAWKWMPDKNPAIIMFYSSLYSPRIEVTGKNDKEQNLLEALDEAVETVQPNYPHPIVTKNFFPYISDMSFVALSDDESGISAVSLNNPGWGTKHYVDYEAIRAINVPVINIGPYGYDAHKQYERMEREFTLNIVPNLTNEVLKNLIGTR